ncbi:reverse transcriptase domain-containing protein [Tanacetum coccineum]
MPKYAKFMKDLLSRKGKRSEASKIILNKQCSAVILNKVPPKEKDPGGFTIPCDLKLTRMCIEFANKTTQFPKGIAENVMVKIDKFVFPVDFVILDMEEDHRIPIILGRSFLATVHAMIDVFNKKISFKVGDEYHSLSLKITLRFPPSGWRTPTILRILNHKIQDVVKAKIVKLLDAGLIYAISDSPWVSPIHVVPKKGGSTVIANKDNELIPTRTVIGWRMDSLDISKFHWHQKTRKRPPLLVPMALLPTEECLSGYVNSLRHITVMHGQNLPDMLKSSTSGGLTSWDPFPPQEITNTFLELSITLATPYHPQTSGQTENTNRAIKRILERTVNGNRKEWVDKLDDALWEFRTTYKTPIGSTPFRIVYEKACHFPIELEHKAYWAQKNADAYEHSQEYKERTKRWHNSKIIDKEFQEGEEVLVFNSRLKLFSVKLRTRRYGPYTVIKLYPYGMVEVLGNNRVQFKNQQLGGNYRDPARIIFYVVNYNVFVGVLFFGDKELAGRRR